MSSRHNHHLIECNVFSPLYVWKNWLLGVKQQSVADSFYLSDQCQSSIKLWVRFFSVARLTWYTCVQHVMVPWVTLWVSYKTQQLLIIRKHMDSPPNFGGVRVAHHISFLCCVFICLSSSSVLCAQCCQCLWIVQSWLPLVFLSNVYWLNEHYVILHQSCQVWIWRLLISRNSVITTRLNYYNELTQYISYIIIYVIVCLYVL